MKAKNLRAGKTLFLVKVMSTGNQVMSASCERVLVRSDVQRDQFGAAYVQLSSGLTICKQNLVDINITQKGVNLTRAFLTPQAALSYARRLQGNRLTGPELDVLLLNEQFEMPMRDEYVEDDDYWDLAA